MSKVNLKKRITKQEARAYRKEFYNLQDRYKRTPYVSHIDCKFNMSRSKGDVKFGLKMAIANILLSIWLWEDFFLVALVTGLFALSGIIMAVVGYFEYDRERMDMKFYEDRCYMSKRMDEIRDILKSDGYQL